MEASANRISVGKVISETFSIYGAHAAVLPAATPAPEAPAPGPPAV